MQYQSYERPVTLFDLFGSLFRYKGRFAFVTLAVLALCAVGVVLFPKRYESEAKLFVRLGRAASMDPTTIGQTISIQESRESEMNSIVDLLQSRGLAERVVDVVGAERVLKKHSWIEIKLEDLQESVKEKLEDTLPGMAASAPEEGMTPEEFRTRKERELAIKELMGDLKIDSPKKSTTVSIAYRGGAPDVARDVVQAVIDSYQQMHVDAYRSGGTLDFFDQQFAEQEMILKQSENLLRNAKNENSIVTMKGKQDSLQTEITDLKKLQLQTEADLEAARARVAKLHSDLDALPKELVSERKQGIAVGSTDFMRDRLYALEIQEKDLASKYVSTHPELQKVREQLRDARDIMSDQPEDREQNTIAVNPVRIEIHNELLLAEASVASAEAKVAALNVIEVNLLDRLNQVNNLEVMSEDLQRKIDIARDNYRNYAKKLEESRINSALDTVALSNVSVVSPPTKRYKHASPSRPLLAIIGSLFALACGAFVAIASDYSRIAKESAAVREVERKKYLSMLELEAAEAELAAQEMRERMAAAKSLGKSDDDGALASVAEQAVDVVETAVKKAK